MPQRRSAAYGRGMNKPTQLLLGVALMVAGAVFALGFPDLQFLIFTGRPLGIVLVLVGLLDVGEALFRGRNRDGR